MSHLTSRRTFLSLAATAAAGSLAACSTDDATKPAASASGSNSSGTHVLVIGAGMSGLAAARTLHDQGHRVTVIEARDRIGGRIWSSTAWSDIPVDLGASWIHGIDGNPVTDLAKKAGAQFVATDVDNSTLYSWRGGEATTDVDDARSELADKVATALSDFAESSEPDAALATVAKKAVGYDSLSQDQQTYVSFALNEYEQEYSGSANKLSARYFESDAELKGDDVLFPGGYGQLPTYLAKGLSVITGQPVTAIDWTSSGVTVTTKSATHQGSHVVVTLPLGVLKSGSVRFGHDLSAEKTKAISALGVGLLDKCFLEFPRVFWGDTDWLEYLPAAGDEGHWTQWVNVHRPTGKPVLLGFNAADTALQVEKLSDEEIVASAMKTLRTMYGSDIPEPTRHQITRWAGDQFAYGSYSFVQLGSTPKMRNDLAASIDDRLFFAGEATSEPSPATVHGAYESGLRAAKEVLAALS